MMNENERLRAVARFKTLDTGIKKDLTDLVNLIANICNVPVALVSVIDEQTQWFKASTGIGDLQRMERHLSFCDQTIKSNQLFILQDATTDSRFANLPAVKNAPFIRSYVGMPLVTFDGHSIGTLCVMHTEPLMLTEVQINSLKVISKQVLNLIELNWSMHSLIEQNLNTQEQKKQAEQSELKLKAVFDSSKDVHLLIGSQMEVMAYNKAAANYIYASYNKNIKVGVHLLTVVSQESASRLVEYVELALKGKVTNVEWNVKQHGDTSLWFDVTFEPARGANNDIIGVVINATDITVRKRDADFINQQNAALQRIATIQSHELRRPVASLLGLMEVLKLDENYVFNSCYPMIEITINELDSKIKDIVHESELRLNGIDDTTNA
ncbi:GAF domain-containing protein [Mucilaginibacter sp. CSA2-8R]|uniref:GAF domain-containing protein n=1 Tax=Mucilaginibacter sp. CSA2-8R TaxID=3141542 RepID=UPI00315D3073